MNSPKILNREDILALIEREEYHLHGRTTVCVLTTKTGFTVTADTTAAPGGKFSVELGRRYALKEAIGKLWPFEVYAQGRMAQGPELPFTAIKALMQSDPEYAWGWHCNLSMPIMDHLYISAIDANEAGAKLMRHLFDVDIWAMFPDRKPVRHTDDRANPTPLGRARMRDYMSAFLKNALGTGDGRHPAPERSKADTDALAGKLAAAFKAEQEADEAAVDALKAAPEAFQVGDIVACEGERWTEAEVTKLVQGNCCILKPNGNEPKLLYGASRLKLLRRPKPAAEALQAGDIVRSIGSAGEWTVLRVLGDGFCKVESNRGESFHVLATHLKLLRRPQAAPAPLAPIKGSDEFTGNEQPPLSFGDITFATIDPVESGPLTDESGPVTGEAEKDGYVEIEPGSKREFVGITIDDSFATGNSRHFVFDGEQWHESASAGRVIGAFREANKRPDTDVPSPAELNGESLALYQDAMARFLAGKSWQ